MRIVRAFPPNYEAICNKFPIRGNMGIVFTYGDTLYNPGNNPISPDLECHEMTHVQQQKEVGPVGWWNKYLSDRKFRLSQEVEAYRNQYRFALNNYSSKWSERLLIKIVKDLSGSMYGKLVDRSSAESLITNP